jgi:tRNA(adenine34) deaminase
MSVNADAQDAHDDPMAQALAEARAALDHHDVPVGAVVVHDGKIIAARHNERELTRDPSAHAEILALRDAARALGQWRLDECTLYVTLEPCAMCAGAASLARVPRVVYGAGDPKGGALGSVIDLYSPPASEALNHRPEVTAGLLATEAASLLEDFFAARR